VCIAINNSATTNLHKIAPSKLYLNEFSNSELPVFLTRINSANALTRRLKHYRMRFLLYTLITRANPDTCPDVVTHCDTSVRDCHSDRDNDDSISCPPSIAACDLSAKHNRTTHQLCPSSNNLYCEQCEERTSRIARSKCERRFKRAHEQTIDAW
jgi:hypothetical protein